MHQDDLRAMLITFVLVAVMCGLFVLYENLPFVKLAKLQAKERRKHGSAGEAIEFTLSLDANDPADAISFLHAFAHGDWGLIACDWPHYYQFLDITRAGGVVIPTNCHVDVKV